jgi:hypothetical protein
MKKRIRSIKIHLWASLTINIYMCVCSHCVSTAPTYIIGLLLVFSLFFIRGLIKTSYDIQVGDTSAISLTFDYVCAIGASSIFAYQIYNNCDDIFLIIYVLIILLEILALVLIIFWNKIIRFFKKIRKDSK